MDRRQPSAIRQPKGSVKDAMTDFDALVRHPEPGARQGIFPVSCIAGVKRFLLNCAHGGSRALVQVVGHSIAIRIQNDTLFHNYRCGFGRGLFQKDPSYEIGHPFRGGNLVPCDIGSALTRLYDLLKEFLTVGIHADL